MMALLIIVCILLAVMTAGTNWILVLVVRNNEKITAERDAARAEAWATSGRLVQAHLEISAKNEIIMAMEAGAGMLERQHNVALEGLHRIIGRLLLKQDGIVENIAGGGGSADPEDEYKEAPQPLRLVNDG